MNGPGHRVVAVAAWLDVELQAAIAVAEAEDLTLTRVVVREIPGCDFCGAPAEFDAEATDQPERPWAFMCGSCFAAHGPGRLGAGYGQRLVLAGSG